MVLMIKGCSYKVLHSQAWKIIFRMNSFFQNRQSKTNEADPKSQCQDLKSRVSWVCTDAQITNDQGIKFLCCPEKNHKPKWLLHRCIELCWISSTQENYNNNNNNNPWHYRLWRTLAGWAAAAGSLSRLHQTVLGWHVVSTLNPTAAFSAFQTGPLLLYSSNYSVYPITRLSGPRSRPNSLRKILKSARESKPGPLCL
jgi:hypothetical protein